MLELFRLYECGRSSNLNYTKKKYYHNEIGMIKSTFTSKPTLLLKYTKTNSLNR